MSDPRANPFPGMNPWLEWRWSGVHGRLITYIADALAEQLPPDLQAKSDERVFFEAHGAVEREFRPDVAIHDEPPAPVRPFATALRSAGGAAVAVAEPVLVEVPDVLVTETFVRIVDARSGGRVITVLELVSPSNKVPGDGRDKYLEKQGEARVAGVSTVEIDLLRGGRPVTAARQANRAEARLAAPYHACVRRADRPAVLEVYPFALRERLPALRVPLRSAEPDIVLDLQPLLDRVFRNANFANEIDYRLPPDPPLAAADAAWARAVVAEAGLVA